MNTERRIRSILPFGVVSCWLPGGGNRVIDIVRGNHGQATGGVSCLPIAPELGWEFDGATGLILVPNAVSLDPSDLTVGCWIKIGTQVHETVFLNRGANFSLQGNNSGFPGFYVTVCHPPDPDLACYSFPAYQPADWALIVGTYEVATGKLHTYLNGVLSEHALHQDALAGSLPISEEDSVAIGAGASGLLPFDGPIAMPFICNRVLSAQEVANLYRETFGFFYPRG